MIHLLAASSGTNLDPLYAKALFWILAILAVAAAITMICVRQAVHCALMLAVVMLCLAVMYAMQGAPFLAFVAFARLHGNLDGQVVAFFVMVVAAAEVVVGLAILMAIYRARRSASVDDANLLKY